MDSFHDIWGNFTDSVIIISVANLIEFDKDEAGAYYQITNNKALQKSMVHASDLIKSFLRYIIIKKKEETLTKITSPSGSNLSKHLPDEVSKRAEYVMHQRAKRFREVNSELMMCASKVHIDTLIQKVFNTVDNQLQGVKDSVFTSSEMENLLSEVESNQKKIMF